MQWSTYQYFTVVFKTNQSLIAFATGYVANLNTFSYPFSRHLKSSNCKLLGIALALRPTLLHRLTQRAKRTWKAGPGCSYEDVLSRKRRKDGAEQHKRREFLPATNGAQEQDNEWMKLGWGRDEKVPKVISRCILGHFDINAKLFKIKNNARSSFSNFEVKGQLSSIIRAKKWF